MLAFLDHLVYRLSAQRAWDRNRQHAVSQLRASLSRTSLGYDEQLIIMAFYIRDGRAARQLSISVIHDRALKAGAKFGSTETLMACSALCGRRILSASRPVFGDKTYRLDQAALEAFVAEIQPMV